MPTQTEINRDEEICENVFERERSVENRGITFLDGASKVLNLPFLFLLILTGVLRVQIDFWKMRHANDRN